MKSVENFGCRRKAKHDFFNDRISSEQVRKFIIQRVASRIYGYICVENVVVGNKENAVGYTRRGKIHGMSLGE